MVEIFKFSPKIVWPFYILNKWNLIQCAKSSHLFVVVNGKNLDLVEKLTYFDKIFADLDFWIIIGNSDHSGFVGHNDACSMPALAAEQDDKLSKTIQDS